MRIAVSGTHCSGKSTLIDDFVAAHGDYVHEPEPYDWLEERGESLAEEPDAADFYRQLELCVERLRAYGSGACVIAERSPLDFLAYILALRELRRGARATSLMESAVELAAIGMQHLDLLVVLPLNDTDGINAPESEDLELREAMNEHLMELITTDAFDLLGNVRVLELHGSRRVRLAALDRECTVGRPL